VLACRLHGHRHHARLLTDTRRAECVHVGPIATGSIRFIASRCRIHLWGAHASGIGGAVCPRGSTDLQRTSKVVVTHRVQQWLHLDPCGAQHTRLRHDEQGDPRVRLATRTVIQQLRKLSSPTFNLALFYLYGSVTPQSSTLQTQTKHRTRA
jgi:hypothetical protein